MYCKYNIYIIFIYIYISHTCIHIYIHIHTYIYTIDPFLVLYTVMLFSLKQLLKSFGDKPLTNLYSSVASIFLRCTETELSVSKRLVKEDVLPPDIIRNHLLCNLFILLFIVRL